MAERFRRLSRIGGMHQVLGNAFLVSLSNGILKASNAALFIIVVHRLGKEAAGQFSIATTLIAISLGLALFGLDEVLMREAVQPGRRDALFANYLLARVVLTVLFAAGLDLLLWASGLYAPGLTGLIILLSLGQIGDGALLLCQALYVSQERTRLVLLTTLAISVTRILLSIILLVLFPGQLLHVVVIFVVTSLAGGALAIRIAVARILGLTPTEFIGLMDVRTAAQGVWRNLSFFWIGIFVMIEFQADVVLLSLLRTTAEVALYSAAMTIILAAWIVPQSYRTAIYLRLTQAYQRSGAEFWRFVRLTAGASLIIGAAFAIVLALGGAILFDFLYPDDYNSSLSVLRILTLPVFFAFVSALSSRVLLTLHRERLAAWLVGASMLVNVTANLLLIPQYGAAGAASARALSAGLFCLMSYTAVAVVGFSRPRVIEPGLNGLKIGPKPPLTPD